MNPRLLVSLTRHASHRGLILASEVTLQRETGLLIDRIRQELVALEAAGDLIVLSPLPFLVARGRLWPSSSSHSKSSMPKNSSKQREAHMEVPVSSNAAAATHTEVGGAGEGGGLLEEVLAVLGAEAGRDEFHRILAGRSPALVRRCLARVRATRRIRVSRAALFRSLLQKLGS